MTKLTKNATDKNQKLKDVLRWIVLVPSVLVAWYVVVLIEGPVPHLMYKFGWIKLLAHLETLLAILGGFVLPCTAVFFVARYVAPKYKNIVAWGSVGVCVLWTLFLVFGLTHMAY